MVGSYVVASAEDLKEPTEPNLHRAATIEWRAKPSPWPVPYIAARRRSKARLPALVAPRPREELKNIHRALGKVTSFAVMEAYLGTPV
jgi:hypothetical protein